MEKKYRNEKLEDLLKRRKKNGALDLNEELTHLINFGANIGERSLQLKKMQFNFSVVLWSGIIVAFAFLFPYRISMVYDSAVIWLIGLILLMMHGLILLTLQLDISNELRRYQRITMKTELLLRINGFDPNKIGEISKRITGTGRTFLMIASHVIISAVLLLLGKTFLQLP